MIHTYSLADHTLELGFSERVARQLNLRDEEGNLLNSISIGGPGENGEGSFVGTITISREANTWSTEGDATGSWVHNKNLNKTGTIALTIRQISDRVIELYQICKIYESIQENVGGLTLTVHNAADQLNSVEAIGNDSYIQKPADLPLQNEAQMLTWTFTCGQVLFY